MKKICCICGREYEEPGNNPSPILEDGQCCNNCNELYVVPARMNELPDMVRVDENRALLKCPNGDYALFKFITKK